MKNLLKNRIVIGLICIILSLIICFGLTPMFNNALKSKVSLVRVNTEIHKGDQITEKMLTTVEVGGYNLPGNVVYRAEDVVGKYANTDLYKGDYILESKLSDTPMLKNAYLGKLNGENRAISVSIKSFAAGLSGKLEAGDIVTLIASDVGEKRETLVLPELQYVEIIATTASSGTDNDVQADVEDGEEQELASTITVLATPEQAERMAARYRDERTFFAPYGVRTLSKMEKMYAVLKSGNPSCWLGPIWGISNYMVFDGLVRYGYTEDAKDLAEKTVRLFGKDIEACGELHEYYDPETGLGVNNPGFQNWNLLSVNMFEWLRENNG